MDVLADCVRSSRCELICIVVEMYAVSSIDFGRPALIIHSSHVYIVRYSLTLLLPVSTPSY